jgi:cytidylate kinase
VASLPAVRAFLLEMQRKTAREHDVIMDGRDIGTVVLPQADLKLYLTADAAARADRRYAELVERGQTVEREQILRDVMERDARDMARAVSPLKQAEDAVVVDTTKMDLEESFHAMLDIIREKLTL